MRQRGRRKATTARGAPEARHGKQGKKRRRRGGRMRHAAHGEQKKRSDNRKTNRGLNNGRTRKCLPHIGRRTVTNNNPLRGQGMSMWLTVTDGKEVTRTVLVGGRLHQPPQIPQFDTAPGRRARTFGIGKDKIKDERKRLPAAIGSRPVEWTRKGEAAVDRNNIKNNHQPLGRTGLRQCRIEDGQQSFPLVPCAQHGKCRTPRGLKQPTHASIRPWAD